MGRWNGWIVWLITMGILWGVPGLLDIGLRQTPDLVTASASAGTFVSSSGSPGGFWSSSASTVQTTTGSMIVDGSFSGSIGQRLTLEHRLKSGLQLCTATGSVCAPLAGAWPGRLLPVPYRRPALAFLAPWVRGLHSLYFAAFVLSFTLGLLILAISLSADENDDEKDAGEQDREAGKAAM